MTSGAPPPVEGSGARRAVRPRADGSSAGTNRPSVRKARRVRRAARGARVRRAHGRAPPPRVPATALRRQCPPAPRPRFERLPPPAPKPTFETWGPFKATPAGALARPAARAAAVVLRLARGRARRVGRARPSSSARPAGRLRSVATLPSRRAGAAAFVDGGAVDPIGGEDGAAAPSDEIIRVDLASHEVTSAGRFVEPLAGAGYVQKGRLADPRRRLDGRAVRDRRAAVHASGHGRRGARLPEPTRDPAVTVRGDTLYVAGGRTETGPSDAVYAVDLGDGTVSVVGHLPRAVPAGPWSPPAASSTCSEEGQAPARCARSYRVRAGHGHDRGRRNDAAPARGRRRGERRWSTYLLGGTRPTAVPGGSDPPPPPPLRVAAGRPTTPEIAVTEAG